MMFLVENQQHQMILRLPPKRSVSRMEYSLSTLRQAVSSFFFHLLDFTFSLLLCVKLPFIVRFTTRGFLDWSHERRLSSYLRQIAKMVYWRFNNNNNRIPETRSIKVRFTSVDQRTISSNFLKLTDTFFDENFHILVTISSLPFLDTLTLKY